MAQTSTARRRRSRNLPTMAKKWPSYALIGAAIQGQLNHASAFSLTTPLSPTLRGDMSAATATASSAWRHRTSLEAHSKTALDAATALSLDELSGASTASFSDLAGSQAMEDPKVGVLLLNLGGPETGEDVEGFLYNLFADPDIIRLPPFLAPLQPLVAYYISTKRAPISRKAYDSIGGGSPILKYTKAQADQITQSLSARYGIDAKTYIGMRYWYPFTEEALDEIRDDGINALVILPLYPQFSISTSGSSLRILQEEFAKKPEIYGAEKMFHTVVPSWYERPGYIKAVADLILTELDSFTPEEIAEGTSEDQPIPKHILFSAHGVPASYIEAGDPYKDQIIDCVDRIKALLPTEEDGVKVHLSFQSRVGPVEWLRPYTDDVLPSLGAEGVKNIVVVPISFVSEHIETLEEIDIEYRELALENGITNWRRSPALNTDTTFIDDMADMVAEALSEPSQSLTEACVANNVGTVDLEGGDSGAGGLEITSAGVGGVGGGDALAGTAMRLQDGEKWNGRLAMVGIAATVVIELLSGKPLTHLFMW